MLLKGELIAKEAANVCNYRNNAAFFDCDLYKNLEHDSSRRIFLKQREIVMAHWFDDDTGYASTVSNICVDGIVTVLYGDGDNVRLNVEN